MSSRSRIVLLTDGLDGQAGGVQRVSRSVFAALSSDTIPTQVWSANDTAATLKTPAHIHLRCFGGQHVRMMLGAMFSETPASCRTIYCMHLRLAPAAAALAWRLKCRLDVFLHGVEAWGGLSLIQAQSLRFATAFSANSRYTLKRFHDAHPEFAGRECRVIPLGLNEEFVAAMPVSHPVLSKAPRYILTVTRFAETYKGERTLIEAFRTVHAAHPEIHLVCAGDGLGRRGLEDFAAEMGLGGSVHFVGHVSDGELAGLYAGSSAFVLLSEGEGFGIVFIEAMYHGKACVATNRDASCEIVRDGETGLLVPPGDVAATIKALTRLVEDAALAERLGQEGRGMVHSNFMPEHFQLRLKKCLGGE